MSSIAMALTERVSVLEDSSRVGLQWIQEYAMHICSERPAAIRYMYRLGGGADIARVSRAKGLGDIWRW